MRQNLNTHPGRLKAKNTEWQWRIFDVDVSPICGLHLFMEPLTIEKDATTHVRNVGKQRHIPEEMHPQSHRRENLKLAQ